MITGASAKTFNNLQLGEGAFLSTKYVDSLISENIISATRGGASITITPQYRSRVIDGIHDNTLEAKVIDYVMVKATFIALEITPSLLAKAIGGADYNETTGVITPRHSLSSADFTSVYWIGELSDGKKVQIIFNNVLNTNGMTLKTASKGEGELSLEFTAHYSVESLDTPPVSIEYIEVPAEPEVPEEPEA